MVIAIFHGNLWNCKLHLQKSLLEIVLGLGAGSRKDVRRECPFLVVKVLVDCKHTGIKGLYNIKILCYTFMPWFSFVMCCIVMTLKCAAAYLCMLCLCNIDLLTSQILHYIECICKLNSLNTYNNFFREISCTWIFVMVNVKTVGSAPV